MSESLPKRIASSLGNLIARRLVHDWRPLTRDEWRHLRPHFSQYGEDLIADDLLSGIERGVYVDVGAFDPIHYSNTLLLHQRGWRGVNVDLREEKIAAFRHSRPNDSSYVAAVGAAERAAWILEYDLPVLDRVTFDPDHDFLAENGDKPLRRAPITITPLDRLLERTGWVERVDYLNIDCEGFEIEVLHGTDLARWRPRLISIEALDAERLARVRAHLGSFGYIEAARTRITAFFALPGQITGA
jgi:FkbM family methyltransferase